MSKIDLSDAFNAKLQKLNGIVADANNQKIALLFGALGIQLATDEFAKLL